MASFENLNLTNFDIKLTSNSEDLPGLNFIIDSGLIPPNLPIPCINNQCSGTMRLLKCAKSNLKKAFVCRVCRKQHNWSKNTIFDGSKLSILLILKLIFCWCQNKTIKITSSDLGISEKTVVLHFKFLQKVSYSIIIMLMLSI